MSLWTKVAISIAIGVALGVVGALAANALGVNRAVVPGAVSGLSAGIIALIWRRYPTR
jgi:hypothetical protein